LVENDLHVIKVTCEAESNSFSTSKDVCG